MEVDARTASWRRVERTYLTLKLLHTLAASLIWGINTLFLLDAGLSATQAFTVNAFYTVGLLVSEVPTGVVADTTGRRRSYLLGCVWLFVATMGHWWMWQVRGPMLGWLVASMVLGLGFAFFSGATDAWLVDAMEATGRVEDVAVVFGRGQTVRGFATLAGSILGGWIAQATNLGMPYVLRGALLVATFVVAFRAMHDLGFEPRRAGRLRDEMRAILAVSLRHGMGNPPVRWAMLAGAFTSGVQWYAFYAMQPLLLELWGNEEAYGIAGLAAAVVASAQIIGGLAVPRVRGLVARRTSALLAAVGVGAVGLVVIGATGSFWVALIVFSITELATAATWPMRKAFLNGCIASGQRATILSFDSMVSSGGSALAQPALGRVADVGGFGSSLAVGGVVQLAAVPLLWLARRQHAPGDIVAPART